MRQLTARFTSWDFSRYELMRIGERRNNLVRWYSYGAGLTAEDDQLPDRLYTEPIRTAVSASTGFQEMMD